MFGWWCTTYPEPSASDLSRHEAQDNENGGQHYQSYIGCDDPRSCIRSQVGPRRNRRYGGHGAEVAASNDGVSRRQQEVSEASVANNQTESHIIRKEEVSSKKRGVAEGLC